MILGTWAFKRSLKGTPMPLYRRRMGQRWGHWAQSSCWAGHCQESAKRNTRKGNTSWGSARCRTSGSYCGLQWKWLVLKELLWCGMFLMKGLFYSTLHYYFSKHIHWKKHGGDFSTSFLLDSIFPKESECESPVTPLACKCLVSDLLCRNFWNTSPQTNTLQAEKVLSRDIFP